MASKARPPLLTRPRPSLKQVDTNIASYDRTDPFAAINALRKLISSLPSRIGGCSLKFTPEEHKLSMHLLTIVEPFVGLTPTRRTLTRQPTEIIDTIVAHLDKPDLLSLGLACRRMYDIVFPRHWDYRVIKCKVSSIGLWNHLVVNRSLAQNVRHLEILDERSTEAKILPKAAGTGNGIIGGIRDTDVESTDDELGMHAKQERFLVAALIKMTMLRTFKWSCCHSPISIDNIWPTLLKCGSLQVVDIRDNMMFCGLADNDTLSNPLLELKTVALRSTPHAYGATKTPSLIRISGMLDNCPNIEALSIAYDHRRAFQGFKVPLADSLFLCARFPNLRILTLTNLSCTSSPGLEAAAAFLLAHMGIEVLHLEIGGPGGTGAKQMAIPLQAGSLPNLRELKASNVLAASILSCPMSTGSRPLETLRGVKLSGYSSDALLIASLRRCDSNKSVKRVELIEWNDLEGVRGLIECLPGVTWLDLGKHGVAPSHPPSTSSSKDKLIPVAMQTNVCEWADVLALIPELTTLHGPCFFYPASALALSALASNALSTSLPASEYSRVRTNQNTATTLLSKCPKLRRLEHWDETSAGSVGKAVILAKHAGEVRLEVKRVKM